MENEELKNMVQETLTLARQNNILLKKMRSAQRWAQITRTVYWLVIIALSIGAYYYVQPYFQKVLSLYTQGVSQLDGVKNIFH